MVKRSTPQRQIDERAFPMCLLILVPAVGFGQLLGAGSSATGHAPPAARAR